MSQNAKIHDQIYDIESKEEKKEERKTFLFKEVQLIVSMNLLTQTTIGPRLISPCDSIPLEAHVCIY